MSEDIFVVDSASYGIYGISKNNEGKKVLIEYALPGDKIRVNIRYQKDDFIVAYITEFIERSPMRNSRGFCRYFQKCGGCTYNDVDYEKQTELKTSIFNDHIQKSGVNVEQNAFIPSSEQFAYRGKTRMRFASNGYPAYYSIRSNSATPIENCPIVTEKINEMIKRISEKNDIIKRTFRYQDEIEIVSADNTVGVHFICKGERNIKQIVKELGISSYVFTNTEKNRFDIFGDKLIKKIGERTFRFNPASFVQANYDVAHNMLKSIDQFIKLKSITGTLIDFYAGFGLLSGYLKDHFKTIYTVENSPYAISDIKHQFTDHSNVNYYNKTVSSTVKYISQKKIKADLIIIDPPRTSPQRFVFEKINSMKSRHIVYVSCNPPALFEHLKVFYKNYYIDSIIGFDMFPNTYHQEVIAFLTLKEEFGDDV